MRSPIVVALLAAVALVACKKSEPAKQAAPPPPPSAVDTWASATPPPAAKPRIDKPFFFSATKDGKTLYLLGTLHVGVDAATQLPPWVLTKLDGARAFAMETDISDPSMVKLLVRTDGKKLSQELSPEDWTKLKATIGDALAEGLDGMLPFATLATLAIKDLPMTAPMDAVLLDRAKTAGKPVIYLESVQAQIDAISPFATAADIHATLANLEYGHTQALQMLKDYLAGDAAALNAMFDDKTLWLAAGRDPARFGDFIEATLTKRNASWIAPLEQMAADGGGFVAVGAAHLVGPDNVPDSLAARGFTVKRLIAGD